MPSQKEVLLPYLKKYGSHCMAYTSLEPEMEYFVLDGVGYIAYISFKHWFWSRQEKKIVLADPVCDASKFTEIIALFVKENADKNKDVIFVQCSRAFASVLNGMGCQVNQFGIETDIPIPHYDLKGKQKAKLRQWNNKCAREGVIIKETPIDYCENIEEIRTLSSLWVEKKGGDDLGFLVRPLRYQVEQGVRYFWAYKDSKLIGMAVFDPIYKANKVIGYYHNIDRISNDAPHGTSASIILHAINVFKEEGVKLLSLGMSPMAMRGGIGVEFNYHPFTRKSFHYAYKKLNFLYSFKGNESHKKKFGGVQKPIYISSTKGTGLWQIFIMLKAIKMF